LIVEKSSIKTLPAARQKSTGNLKTPKKECVFKCGKEEREYLPYFSNISSLQRI
jgi:hypothetical protein